MKINTHAITIPVRDGEIHGDLAIPEHSSAAVIFAHGSGSSRHSPRNKLVANYLNEGRISTLLMDLLTPEEERVDDVTRHLRFDVWLLADRLIAATDLLLHRKPPLRIGYFGASTGAAAALIAASRKPDVVEAIVSRGGRPDLAGSALSSVHAPVLLIVGGEDDVVISLNEQAARELHTEYLVEIVAGASHLFEEPGALEQVARLARRWFEVHLMDGNVSEVA